MKKEIPKDSPLNTDDRFWKVEEMPYVSMGGKTCYCIFRVGRKYKTIGNIKGFAKHMTREKETPNADPERAKANEILYGPEDIYKDTKEYLKDCGMINKNSTVGRELLLTASPEFFKGVSPKDFEKWKTMNIQWLEYTFKDNFRYAILHMDETSPHIHALVVPKLWTKQKRFGKYEYEGYSLQAYKYFNGMDKLRGLQDSYASFIQQEFKVLQRGKKGSQAHHIPIRQFYSMVNKELDPKDIQNVLAHAKNEEMLKVRMNYLDKTLKSYQNFNKKTEQEKKELYEKNKELLGEVEKLQEDKEIYKEAVTQMSKLYKINPETFEYALEYVKKEMDKTKVKDKILDQDKSLKK